MRFILSVLSFWLMAVGQATLDLPVLPSGSIVYPIVNATQDYNFEFVEIISNPEVGGPCCVVCKTSSCTDPCPSSVSNPQNCQCLLSPNGYQWLNNMEVAEGNSVSIRYRAYTISGEYIGTFLITISLSSYRLPEITTEDGFIPFGASYLETSNNSVYSGPCWAIIVALI